MQYQRKQSSFQVGRCTFDGVGGLVVYTSFFLKSSPTCPRLDRTILFSLEITNIHTILHTYTSTHVYTVFLPWSVFLPWFSGKPTQHVLGGEGALITTLMCCKLACTVSKWHNGKSSRPETCRVRRVPNLRHARTVQQRWKCSARRRREQERTLNPGTACSQNKALSFGVERGLPDVFVRVDPSSAAVPCSGAVRTRFSRGALFFRKARRKAFSIHLNRELSISGVCNSPVRGKGY